MVNISRLWGDKDRIDKDGGIEIYSSDPSYFGQCTIYDCETNAFMIRDSGTEFRNCSIYDVGDDAIELHYSDARIINTTIRDCEFGIFMFASDPLIENWSIYNIEQASLTKQDFSDPTLINNDIEGLGENGIYDYLDVVALHLVILLVLMVWLKPWNQIRFFKEL